MTTAQQPDKPLTATFSPILEHCRRERADYLAMHLSLHELYRAECSAAAVNGVRGQTRTADALAWAIEQLNSKVDDVKATMSQYAATPECKICGTCVVYEFTKAWGPSTRICRACDALNTYWGGTAEQLRRFVARNLDAFARYYETYRYGAIWKHNHDAREQLIADAEATGACRWRE